jgi:hypothetical protein
MCLARTVQIALLGEVPSTLRFLYVSLIEQKLNFNAVFTNEATDDHLEALNCVLTEIIASCPCDITLNKIIERNSDSAWKINNGENLMYLRYGELSNV